jgi:hypothetical protein
VSRGRTTLPGNIGKIYRCGDSPLYEHELVSLVGVALDNSAVRTLHRRMNEPPSLSPRKQEERAARNERLAQALRDNLRRRKEQARVQAERAPHPGDVRDGLSGAPLSGKTNRHGGMTAD